MDLRDLSILVVSDNANTASSLRNAFIILGARGTTAQIGAEACLNLMCETVFDALYYDAHMNFGPARQAFVADIRNLGDHQAVMPIFAVHNRPTRKLVEQLRDAGVSDVIRGPLRGEIVTRKLKTACETPRILVRSKGFVGPDRRSPRRSRFTGVDRRHAAEADDALVLSDQAGLKAL